MTDAIRVAVAFDFAEERWPSMDLVGAMLLENLERFGPPRVQASQVCPPFRRRFTRIPAFGGRATAVNADRVLNRVWFYPRFIHRLHDKFDLFHIVDHSYSQLIHYLPAGRTVVTCHDLDTFQCLLSPNREQRSMVFRAMARQILNGFRRAARIICVSGWTRDQILRHKLVPAERLEVVPNGVGPAFTALHNPTAETELEPLLRSVGSAEIYLLHVGSTLSRKRVDVLLRTFARVHRELSATRLLRVGGPFNDEQLELLSSLGIQDSVTVLPFLTPEALAAVYRRSTLLLLPSEAEGFGLPVIEAMACGTPVLASDIPVLREVGGSAAEYCPVADIDAWTGAVVSLLHERFSCHDKWNSRRQLGIEHASQFTWAANAKRMIAIYAALRS